MYFKTALRALCTALAISGASGAPVYAQSQDYMYCTANGDTLQSALAEELTGHWTVNMQRGVMVTNNVTMLIGGKEPVYTANIYQIGDELTWEFVNGDAAGVPLALEFVTEGDWSTDYSDDPYWQENGMIDGDELSNLSGCTLDGVSMEMPRLILSGNYQSQYGAVSMIAHIYAWSSSGLYGVVHGSVGDMYFRQVLSASK